MYIISLLMISVGFTYCFIDLNLLSLGYFDLDVYEISKIITEKNGDTISSLTYVFVNYGNNINYIELTSGNHRKAAHYFYRNRNFKIKDTTVFIKIY